MQLLARYAFVRDVLWLTCGLKVALGWFGPTSRQLDTQTHLLQAAFLLAFTLTLVPAYPRPGGPVPGGSLANEDDTGRVARLPSLAVASVFALVLGNYLVASDVVALFLATAAVFTLGIVVFSASTTASASVSAFRDALWSALLTAFLYLYVFSGPANLASFAIAAVLVALVWFGITRLPGGKSRTWLLRIATTLTGGATAYAFALLVAGIPFGLACLVLVAYAASVVWLRARPPLAGGAARWGRLARRCIALCVAVVPGLIAAVLLFGWAIAAGKIHRSILDVGGPLRFSTDGGSAPVVPANASSLELARAFSPFLVVTEDERWLPSPVEPYLHDAVFVGSDGRLWPGDDVLSGARETSACVQHGRRCSVMLGQCDFPKITCVEGDRCNPRGPCSATLATCRLPTYSCAEPEPAEERDSVVYARLVPDPLGRAQVPKAARSTLRKPLGGLTVVIEYWVFYRYDDWFTWAHRGFDQWHDGDWEWVAIGLAGTKPLFAAFSSHCGGTWTTWDRLETAPGTFDPSGHLELGGTAAPAHLVVYVGRGSHAMYSTSTPRPPDWTTCLKAPPLYWAASWGPSQSIGIRERLAGSGARGIGPRVIDITDERQPWVRFRGGWSSGEHLKILWGAPFGRADCKEKCSGGGPNAPIVKSEWSDPVSTIFCGRYWRPKKHCPPRAGVTQPSAT